MGRRLALLIGNSLYDDPTFPPLAKAKADARAMAKVLGDRNIGEFKVTLLLDEVVETMRQTIASFFQQGRKDDFLLLYFSGHGDAWNKSSYLHLIGRDTKTQFSVAQVVSSTFIKEVMDLCASKTQVLILDCCNSGAFVQGIKGKPQVDEKTASLFTGSGHAVLTASSATQPAWEGDAVTPLSLFTHYLFRGLATGEAGKSKSGLITLDEWYEYAETGVINETSYQQKPSKTIEKQQGSIIIAKNLLTLQQASQPAPPGKLPSGNFVQPITPDSLRGTPSSPHLPSQAPPGNVQTSPSPLQRPPARTTPTPPISGSPVSKPTISTKPANMPIYTLTPKPTKPPIGVSTPKPTPSRSGLWFKVAATLLGIVVLFGGVVALVMSWDQITNPYPSYMVGRGTIADGDPLSVLHNWTVSDPSDCSVQNNALYISTQNAPQDCGGLDKTGNFALEAQVNMTYLGNNLIDFSFTDNSYCGGIDISTNAGTKDYNFEMCSGGNDPIVQHNTLQPPIFPEVDGNREFGTLGIVVNSQNIFFYMDQTQVAKFNNDNSGSSVIVNFFAETQFTDTNPLAVSFSNLRIWR